MLFISSKLKPYCAAPSRTGRPSCAPPRLQKEVHSCAAIESVTAGSKPRHTLSLSRLVKATFNVPLCAKGAWQ
eukprot:15545953-Heterocapsa_arctica.AAC.1